MNSTTASADAHANNTSMAAADVSTTDSDSTNSQGGQRFWDDWVNPITIRELQRSLRNYTVLSILLLFLVGQLLFLAGMLLFTADRYQSEFRTDTGTVFATGVFTILQIAIGCLIPAYAGLNMTLDRNQSASDLLFITTLTPYQIVWGKFCNSIALTFLIFSSCLPFLLISYLLRGIDLQVIAILLVIGAVVAICCTLFNIWLGALPFPIIVRLFIGILGFGWCCCVTLLYCTSAWGIINSPEIIARVLNEWRIFAGLIIAQLFILSQGWGFFHLAASLMSPPNSNYSLPVRRYISLAWLISFVIILLPAYDEPFELLYTWMFYWGTLFSAAMLIEIGGPRSWSVRIRKEIPKSWWHRLLAYPFFTGVTNGVLWILIMMLLTVIVAHTSAELISWLKARVITENEQGIYLKAITIKIHGVVYGLLALLLCRKIPQLSFNPRWTGLVAVGLMIFITTISALLQAIIEFEFNGRSVMDFYVLSPVILIENASSSYEQYNLKFSCLITGLIGVVLLLGFYR